MIFDKDIQQLAGRVLDACRARALTLVTAESCTGGLIAAALTDIPGSSDVLDRGLIAYSNAAKTTLLGVPEMLLRAHGAVSAEVARAMAAGALQASGADAGIAVTGIAGPAGGSAEKPVGLVHVAAQLASGESAHEKLMLGDIGRTKVRIETVRRALALLLALIEGQAGRG